MKFCLLVARKGSQRLPGKNKMLLNGKPLFQWSLEAALTAEVFDEVWISSDDKDILGIGSSFPGVLMDERPTHLCGPKIKATEVLTYMIDKINKPSHELEMFCLLQPTSPFREASHIKKAMIMLESPNLDFVVGIRKYDTPPEFALDIKNGLRPINKGYLTKITRTQDVPESYHPAGGLFAGKIKPYLINDSFYGERSAGLVLDQIPAWDINNEDDFRVAKILARALTSKDM
jgi:CMP-N-acetylneuraminic acid synthetase